MIKCKDSWSFIHGKGKRCTVLGEEKDVLDEYMIITSRLIASGFEEKDVVHSVAVGVCYGNKEKRHDKS